MYPTGMQLSVAPKPLKLIPLYMDAFTTGTEVAVGRFCERKVSLNNLTNLLPKCFNFPIPVEMDGPVKL